MKLLLSFLLTSTLLFALEEANEEIAQLDISLISEPVSITEFEIPEPRLNLKNKSPVLAATLSIVPGLGNFYLGDFETSSFILSSMGTAVAGMYTPSYFIQESSSLTIQTVWAYGFYSSYRDARIYRENAGYDYQMPTDSFAEIALSPFSPSILKKPEVWGAVLVDLALAITLVHFTSPRDAHIQLSTGPEMNPLFAFPVGISEETFFRGFLLPFFSEYFTPTGGIILSSIAFGAAHIPNARYMTREDARSYYALNIPLITLTGAYLGWLTYKNNSLKEAVAYHSWYDFIVFSLVSLAELAEQTIRTGKPSFAFSFDF